MSFDLNQIQIADCRLLHSGKEMDFLNLLDTIHCLQSPTCRYIQTFIPTEHIRCLGASSDKCQRPKPTTQYNRRSCAPVETGLTSTSRTLSVSMTTMGQFAFVPILASTGLFRKDSVSSHFPRGGLHLCAVSPSTSTYVSTFTGKPFQKHLRCIGRPCPSSFRMASEPSKESSEDERADPKSPTVVPEEDERPSVWGVVSFAIIFAIFALGIVATVARDFIPGGITTPVS